MKIVPYEEKFGEINFPAGFEEKLQGKTLEEQMECYRITDSMILSHTAYGKLDEQRRFGKEPIF